MKCNILRSYKIKRASSINLLNRAIDIIESHSLFQHDFFTLYSKKELPRKSERKWLLQRTFLSKNFPRFYGNIVSKSTDSEFLKPFVDQLWEELGSGHRGKIHYYQLLDTLNALGISNIEVYSEDKTEGTKTMLNSYEKWTNHENPIVGGGVFGIAIEPIISMDCNLSIEGLKLNNKIDNEDIIYFIDHEGHDYRHSFDILDVAFPRIRNEKEIELILQGTIEILDARLKFYDSFLI